MLASLAALMLVWLLYQGGQQAWVFRDAALQQLTREQQALATLPELERALQSRLTKISPQETASTEALNALAQQHQLDLRLVAQHETWRIEQASEINFTQFTTFLAAAQARWGLTASQLHIAREKQYIKLLTLELRHAE